MRSLFQRKQIADPSEAPSGGLRRVLGTGDLVMLSIGAVIGAGIFSTLGTAAAGEVMPDGEVIRHGAGPALTVSFLLLGVVCALAALCYAELASMIPQAGSAYAYSYATLGEIIAWIIGWDLILEYAVGNVAVAIAWAGYFNSLISPWVQIPGWLTHGYFNVHASSDPAIRALLDTAPRAFGLPVLVNLPAFLIILLITWLLVIGVKESTRVNNAMVVVKLVVLAIFVGVGAAHINPAHYTPFAPNGFTGIHQAAAIVFFAYIGFDAISTAAEETKDPQRTMPRGILLGLGVCTVIYVIVGAVATGLIPYLQLRAADPLAHAFQVAGLTKFSWLISLGAVVSMSAVILVFQYGQPRIFYAMARDGLLPPWAARVHPKYRTPHITTIITGVLVALGALVADDAATYDLTNIGTLSAFLMVCLGVPMLRLKDPSRHRPFKVPFVWPVSLGGAAACLFVMKGLPVHAWERFGIWLAIGLVIYFVYGYRYSVLRHGRAPVELEGPGPTKPPDAA
ncbi:Amino acid permease [Cystobacter fuscus DSM 2262]|uniref:Amino acid permease n=1 Tax=Cystobacter fuscus (strain ATCC 25194 / DSM 2262 / NBRC 100088 / M29) TaxID=1242864 RepID=S9P2X3_CYSF2|nr:amino acid permease [Cystobacter fuscus]EPX57506.1 Amino acid permease [Cystobacter fuscus DSM 2262]